MTLSRVPGQMTHILRPAKVLSEVQWPQEGQKKREGKRGPRGPYQWCSTSLIR